MTDEDRLRAALRLALIPARRWVDGCPHPGEDGAEVCVVDDGDSNLCDGCRADIEAAIMAGEAVSGAPWAVGAASARALAIVRAAGLDVDPEPGDRETVVTHGERPLHPHTMVPMVSDGRGGWAPDFAPGDVAEVASVETLVDESRRCVCCGRVREPEPVIGIVCYACARRCDDDPRACAVRPLHDFADALRPRLGPHAEVFVVDGAYVQVQERSGVTRYRVDREAVETLRRLVDEGVQRDEIVKALERWRA